MKGQFLHNSFLESYREPLGARTTGERITLSLRADSYDEISVKLCIYSHNNNYKLDMHKNSNGKFLASIELPHEPCVIWYNFEIKCGEEIAFYCPKSDRSGGIGSIFDDGINKYQITVCRSGFKTPDDFKGALMYQIFPDRFASSGEHINTGEKAHKDKGRNFAIHTDWNDEVKFMPNEDEEFYSPDDFFCGDLKGIEDKLDYLASLGVDVVYLNPIFEAASNHRYNTADYMNIDPFLGNNEDFSGLCKKAEEKGIKLIIDGVFSHTGSDSIYFSDALKGPESSYYSWYMFDSFPDEYSCWWGFKTLPEVNEHDIEWQKFIIDNDNSVIKHWIDMGASGLRLDVADELPDDVIKKMRYAVKSRGTDNLLLGEVWENATTKLSYGKLREYALGEALDSVMNYPFRDAVIDFLTYHTDAKQFCDFLCEQQQNYHHEMYYCLMNLLSSHDVARMRTVLALGGECKELSREDQSKIEITSEQDTKAAKLMKLAIAAIMTVPGMPSLYYGDECGMHGLKDPFNRRPFKQTDYDMTEYCKQWGNLRKNKVFRTGDFFAVPINEDIICLCRSICSGIDTFGMNAENACAITVINRGESIKRICIDLQKVKRGISLDKSKEIYNYGYTCAVSALYQRSLVISDGLLEFDIEPFAVDCLLLKKEDKK